MTPGRQVLRIGADRRPHAVRCGVGSLRYGVRLPHWPFLRLETGRFAIFMVNGSYGFRVASPGIGRGAARLFTWGQSQRVLLTGRFTRTEATAPALFPSAPGLGVAT